MSSERKREYDRKRYKTQRERVLERSRNYRKNHRAEAVSAVREWRKKNPAKLREQRQRHERARLKRDVGFRLKKALRSRLYQALKGMVRVGSAVRDLGCTIEELRTHLEMRFRLGMTWKNWGNGEGRWNVDHIRPLASFDLTNREQYLLACHYTNLQPLWWRKNLLKGSRV